MRFSVLFFACVFIALPAYADCAGPIGSAGTMDYFGAPDNSFKFCNGISWISMSGGSGVPAGAVMAFDLTVCPAGWTEYTAARGRFLRGLDNGAGNDPDGTRALGSFQSDLTKIGLVYEGAVVNGNIQGSSTGSTFRFETTGNTGTVNSSGVETRPKNVAVLFCRKS
jgi:hypothetical protein